MSHRPSVVGFFCQDIRQESPGLPTLVGLLPDSLGFPAFPAVIPRLGIYVRLQLGIDWQFQPISHSLLLPNGKKFDLGHVSRDAVQKIIADGKMAGSSVVGMIGSGMYSQMQIATAGRIQIITKIGQEEILAAELIAQLSSVVSA